MKKILAAITRLVGLGLWVNCLWLLLRFIAYGDNHPMNAVLGLFGIAPVMLNIADMGLLNSGLLKIFSSLLSAAMIYIGLGGLAIAVTQELSFLIAAGGLKKYRELERAPAEPVSGITGMLFSFVMGPEEREEPNLKAELEQRFALEEVFAAGQGVVTISPDMTDQQMLVLIKSAFLWSKGKAFKVVPPAYKPE
ncbi:hypothetical protein [Pseudomonas chlororaphis]|uniref:hypothetical protein n=1 Tax=Pseudomonas chlororaphis TaxID=587753 RepID=UPI0024079CBB|nr:hypothetical protein [Pseudomonas chlororaphis]